MEPWEALREKKVGLVVLALACEIGFEAAVEDDDGDGNVEREKELPLTIREQQNSKSLRGYSANEEAVCGRWRDPDELVPLHR